MGSKERFSIRQLVELTGLSEFTVRGWENRYGAFTPERSDSGRRGYSKSDVERALLLRELLKRGHKISKIAGLSNARLQQLFERSETPAHEPVCQRSAAVARALEQLALQRWDELEATVRSAKAKSAGELTKNFFLPLVGALAQAIQQDRISIAQEHVLSALMKEKIYSLLSSLKVARVSSDVRFVLCSPEGDHHEIGLLLAHLSLRERGFTSLYLGPNTPARELAETAQRFEASHVLVASTVGKKGGAHRDPLAFVSELRQILGPNARILLAGPMAPATAREVPALEVLNSFEELWQLLDKLEAPHG